MIYSKYIDEDNDESGVGKYILKMKHNNNVLDVRKMFSRTTIVPTE